MQLTIGTADTTRLIVNLAATSLQRSGADTRPNDDEILVIISDITRRAQAEQALQESEARWRSYIHHAPIGIFIADTEGRYRLVNPAACRLTALSEEELLRRRVSNILPPENQQAAEAHYRQLAELGESSGEFCYRRPNGEERWWSVAAARLSAEYNIGFVEDITERKNLEIQRSRLQDEVNKLAKAESLGRMAGAIAHYFNNTLMAVLGNLELAIEEAAPQGGATSHILNSALQSTWRAAEMSSLMLTYLGQTVEKKEPVDLAEVCRRGLPLLQLAKPENVSIAFTAPEPGPLVIASSNQLQQIISNLLANAWESLNNQAGTIELAISTVSAPAIALHHRHPPDWQIDAPTYACLAVTDRGSGISTEDLESIFDPFFSRKFPGRGMGLAVVVGILRSHSGGITVSSHPGEGSTFRVYLPICPTSLANFACRSS